MKLTKKSWIKLPLVLKQIPGITRAAADVGAVIIHEVQRGNPVQLKDVAAVLALNEKTVRRAVQALEAAELIRVDRRHGSASTYALTPHCIELCESAIRSDPAPRARAPKPVYKRSHEMTIEEVAAIDPELAEYMKLSNKFLEEVN